MDNKQLGVIIVVILGVAFAMGAFGSITVGDVTIDPIGGEDPDDNVSTSFAPHDFTIRKRGVGTALTSVPVFGWYDWNENGLVDIGNIAEDEGEIEHLTSDSSTGLVSTVIEYPIGESVLYQVQASGYQVQTFSRVRSSVPSAWNGDALSVVDCSVTLTDTGVSRVSAEGNLLVTDTGDFNTTTAGTTTPQFTFRHTATSSDAGINQAAYTNWDTAKQYSGTIVAATFTNQDFVDLNPDGYDGIFVGASETTIYWNVAGYFNDAGITGDEVFLLNFNLDVTAAGDVATIGMYQGIELKNLAIGILGSAVGTYETNLDIVMGP